MSALTVQQLATLSGITVRTLHYYDEVGLLKPSFIKENGYRYYDTDAQLKLQQILFFKELDFSLEQIQNALKLSDKSRLKILEDQKALLLLKKKRLEKIVQSIEDLITNLKGGDKKMKNQSDIFKSFNMDEIKQYEQEAKERWGATDAYKESVNNTKNWTKADYVRVQQEWGNLLTALAATMEKGPNSKEAQEVTDQIYKHLFQFYTPNTEMFRGLGEMYVADARFKKTFENIQEGLAEFARDAISIYCDRYENKA